jgi:hypothetical protein
LSLALALALADHPWGGVTANQSFRLKNGGTRAVQKQSSIYSNRQLRHWFREMGLKAYEGRDDNETRLFV